MAFVRNPHINRLAAHSTLNTLAWGVSGVFWTVFLRRAGVAPDLIFLAFGGTLMLRLALRPMVLRVVPLIGPGATLMLGTALVALQYPALALVHGPGLALVACCVVTAAGSVFYWTCYHAFFAALGDHALRGRQLAVRQMLGAIAGIVGPIVGGVMLARWGPWSAFGAAAAIEAAALLPLVGLPEPRFERVAPREAYARARVGAVLFFTDGWIAGCTMVSWDTFMFGALGARFDAFGGALALSALVGALGGAVLGRVIDLGHARPAAFVNAAALAATLLLKSLVAAEPLPVLAPAAKAAPQGGFYIPALMIAVYNAAKAAPCPLRFQFVAEGGWDIGGALACALAAIAAAMGTGLQTIILFALPVVAVQALVLNRHYAAHA